MSDTVLPKTYNYLKPGRFSRTPHGWEESLQRILAIRLCLSVKNACTSSFVSRARSDGLKNV